MDLQKYQITYNKKRRISYEEEWTGSDGYWFNGDYEFKDATIINFSDETADDWIKVREFSDNKYYYYYRVKLKKGESTSALINSVTFNRFFLTFSI